MKHCLRAAALLEILLLLSQCSFAQNGVIKGLVKDPYGRPAQNASIQLLKQEDSAVMQSVLSDTLGSYTFKKVPEGSFLITASATGMDKIFTPAFQVPAGDTAVIPDILYFGNISARLQDITVHGRKQLIEQKADRLVINVKNSITDAGGTALDVLEKSPGVAVNRQSSSIAINGKNGVSVMINGKISYMPAEAMVQFLAGIPAGNIDRIELITTPPSRYDASGNGGYINIVLTANPYAGLNGSYFLTAGFNDAPLGAAGVNVNFRSSKFNLFGNYSFRHDHYTQPFTSFTRFTRNGDTISNNALSNRNAIQDVQNIRLGMDYQPDSSNVLGVLVSGYNSRWHMIAHSRAIVSKNNFADSTILSVDDPELNVWQNGSANINFQHRFKAGNALYLDANYIYYRNNNPNHYVTDYYNRNGDFLQHEQLNAGKVTPIHFWIFSADYKTPIRRNITMESGAKLSFSTFTNNASLIRLIQGTPVTDTGSSSQYLLKENTAALYSSLDMQLSKNISVRAGLRYEYSTSNLGSATTNPIAKRKYGELFPTLYFSGKIDADNTITASYARRITRPAFNDLAPFAIFFDPKTFFSGNPTLQPAIANTLQAGYAFKKYTFSISYTFEKNPIDNFYFQTQRVDSVSGIVYLSPRNFRQEQYLTASFSLPVTVTGWWTIQNNLSANWRRINTSFAASDLSFQYVDADINSTQHFNLPKTFSVELTAFYASAGYGGTAKIKPRYQLDAGLQKTFGKNDDLLRFSAGDIFHSGSYYRFSETLPGTAALVRKSFNFGITAYRLTYTHHFGNGVLKAKRDRMTGAEDELKRVPN